MGSVALMLGSIFFGFVCGISMGIYEVSKAFNIEIRRKLWKEE